MRTPPDHLLPLLHSLESATIHTYREHPKLIDKDVEAVFDRMQRYFTAIHAGKDVADPEVSLKRKQALVDNLLDIIDLREDQHADDELLHDPTIFGGVTSLDSLYVKCFKFLGKSARNWRKRNGRTGYLDFITENVVG